MRKWFKNRKGEATVLTAIVVGFPACVAGTMLLATVVGSVIQPNGPAQMRQDRKRIWCQVTNKGKEYCHAQYPRM